MSGGLRYRIAPVYRFFYRVLPRPRGFRALILHHVPAVEVSALEELIDYMQSEHGVISPEEAEAILSGDRSIIAPGKTPWLLTFDDGFASNYSIAESVLKSRSIRALFFVCPGLIDAPQSEQSRLVDEYVFPSDTWKPSWALTERIMTWSEVRALAAMGHSVGSHSMLHRRLSRLSVAEMEADVAASAGRLKQELGNDPRWFAFPFGNLESASPQVLAAVARRFQFCCSGIRGVNDAGTHRAAVLRDGMDLSTPSQYQKMVADGGLDVLYRRHRRRLGAMAAAANQPVT